MPISQLTSKELEQLLSALVAPDGAHVVHSILGSCHEHHTSSSLMPYEKYFLKRLAYRDFDLHIPKFVTSDSRITEMDIQFKRKSRFPAPYINRNHELARELQSILEPLYNGELIHSEFEKKDRKTYYKAALVQYEGNSWREWTGECILTNEPNSSGQTDEDLTDIRNDFVTIRFIKTQK